MRDQFDISGVFEKTEFEIAQVACTRFYGGSVKIIKFHTLSGTLVPVCYKQILSNLLLQKFAYAYTANYLCKSFLCACYIGAIIKVCSIIFVKCLILSLKLPELSYHTALCQTWVETLKVSFCHVTARVL